MKRIATLFCRLAILGALAGGGYWLLSAPQTPLPPRYNPVLPMDLGEGRGPLTGLKMRRALTRPETCLAALSTGASFDWLEPLAAREGCGIETRVLLRRVGGAALNPVETACETALRLAVWERYSLRPAARAFGMPVTRLSHQGSYNCRPIRGGTRMSSHAMARAIDIRAVTLADGRDIALLANWQGDTAEAQFWRALRDGGCDWFTTVLGPDFNAAHADHLHLQSGGWGTCR